MSLNLQNQAQRFFAAIAFGILLLAAPGCKDEKDFSRSQNLLAFFDPANPQPTNARVSIFGGDTILYVRSNVQYSLKFRSSDKQSGWVRIDTIGYDPALEAMKYRISCSPMPEGTFEKRTGTLSFVCPEEYLGQFILFTQGFTTRLKEDFSWLNTGSDIPFKTTGEKLFKDWTAAQKEIGWQAPFVGNQPEAYVYSKKGYVKLGDGTHAADLLTPDLAKMMVDSVVVLAFKAVAYADEQGIKDGNKLTLSVENGGRFCDDVKQVELELPYYDPADPEIAKNMWDKTTRVFLLVTDKTEKFTDKTAIRFSVSEGSNRVFLDDITLYTVDKDSFKLYGDRLGDLFGNLNF